MFHTDDFEHGGVVYSLLFLLFLLLCWCVPVVGYNMNLASVGQGASDKQFGTLSRWRFKEPDVATNRERDDQSRASRCLTLLLHHRRRRGG